MTDISQQVREGQKKWSKGINIDPDDINIADINDFIQFKILEYEVYDFKDSEMWEIYKEDFQNFTVEIFKDCNQFNIQKLRVFLQNNGVWVKQHRNATVPESLYNTLQEEEPTEWTELEIREYVATGKKFNSDRINYLLKNNFASTSTSTSTTENPTPRTTTETPTSTSPTLQPTSSVQPIPSTQPTSSS